MFFAQVIACRAVWFSRLCFTDSDDDPSSQAVRRRVLEAIGLYFSRLLMQVVQHHLFLSTGLTPKSARLIPGRRSRERRVCETVSRLLRGLMWIFGDLVALSAAMSSPVGQVVLGGDGLMFRPWLRIWGNRRDSSENLDTSGYLMPDTWSPSTLPSFPQPTPTCTTSRSLIALTAKPILLQSRCMYRAPSVQVPGWSALT